MISTASTDDVLVHNFVLSAVQPPRMIDRGRMGSKHQRALRQRRRRHHASRQPNWFRIRTQDYMSDGRTEPDAARLAVLEMGLLAASGQLGLSLEPYAERCGRALLWASTFRDAKELLTRPGFGVCWLRLADALDRPLERTDDADEYDEALALAQVRLYDLAVRSDGQPGTTDPDARL